MRQILRLIFLTRPHLPLSLSSLFPALPCSSLPFLFSNLVAAHTTLVFASFTLFHPLPSHSLYYPLCDIRIFFAPHTHFNQSIKQTNNQTIKVSFELISFTTTITITTHSLCRKKKKEERKKREQYLPRPALFHPTISQDNTSTAKKVPPHRAKTKHRSHKDSSRSSSARNPLLINNPLIQHHRSHNHSITSTALRKPIPFSQRARSKRKEKTRS